MDVKTIFEKFRNGDITEEEKNFHLAEAKKKEETDYDADADEDEEDDDEEVVESKKGYKKGSKKENLDNFGDKKAKPFDGDDDDDDDDEDLEEAQEPKAKGADKEEIDGEDDNEETVKAIKKSVPKKSPDLSKVKESFDADLNALVDSEATLSESFKEKASVIFEAAFKSKLVEEINRLEESYQEQLLEETKSIHDTMVEKVDGYLSYVVEGWMKENELAITNGLRSEIAESFMTSLQSVFKEHYVDVPDSKVDLVDGLAEKVEKLEEELSTAVNKSIELKEDVKELSKEKVLREAAKDLTETQAEKLVSLASEIEYATEEAYTKKVDILKESYFGESTIQGDVDLEEINENYDPETSPVMAQYLKAINRK